MCETTGLAGSREGQRTPETLIGYARPQGCPKPRVSYREFFLTMLRASLAEPLSRGSATWPSAAPPRPAALPQQCSSGGKLGRFPLNISGGKPPLLALNRGDSSRDGLRPLPERG